MTSQKKRRWTGTTMTDAVRRRCRRRKLCRWSRTLQTQRNLLHMHRTSVSVRRRQLIRLSLSLSACRALAGCGVACSGPSGAAQCGGTATGVSFAPFLSRLSRARLRPTVSASRSRGDRPTVLCPCVRAVLLSDMGELCGSAQIKGWLKLEPRLVPAGSHTV